MAVIENGHGGTITLLTDTTITVAVRSWSLEDTAQVHDVSVMGEGVADRSFIAGLRTWAVTAEFFGAADTDFAAHKAGTATGANIALKATSASTGHSFTGSGIVESLNYGRDVDQAGKGTIRIKGTGALSVPDGS